MTSPHSMPRRLSTLELVSSYLQEHLGPASVLVLDPLSRPTPDSTPELQAVISFMAGPFRFLCPADATLAEAPGMPCSVVIEAADLVPAPYREQLGAALRQGRDTIWFRGGRLEIRGCSLEDPTHIRPASLISRGPRAAGTSRS